MSIAGILEIQLMADMAQLTTDMKNAENVVQRSVDKMGAAVEQAKKALEALGIGLGALEIKDFIAEALESADALYLMSQKIGISVESLSGYQLALKQSGVSNDQFAMGIKNLSVYMAKHSAELATLGVTSEDTSVAFQQLADVFQALPPGFEKNALAVEIFKKSGLDLIPVLNKGSEGLQDAADKSQLYAEKMALLAPLSHELTDKLEELKISGGGLGTTIGLSVVPIFTALVELMQKAKDEAEKVGPGFDAVGESLKALIVLGSTFVTTWAVVGIELAARAAQVTAIATGNWSGVSVIQEQMMADQKAIIDNAAAFESKILSMKTGLNSLTPAVENHTQKTAAEVAALQAAADAITNHNKQTDASITLYNSVVDKVNTYVDAQVALAKKGKALTEGEKLEIDMKEKLGAAYDANIAGALEYGRALEDAGLAQKALNAEQLKEQEIINKLGDSFSSWVQTEQEGMSLLSTSELTRQKELDSIAKAARTERDASLKYYQEGKGTIDDYVTRLNLIDAAYEDQVTKTGEVIDANDKLNATYEYGAKQALRDYMDALNNVAARSKSAVSGAFTSLENTMADFFLHGKLNFSNFIDYIEQALAKLAAQQFMVSIVAGITGSAAAGAAGAATSGATASSGGNWLSAGSSIANGFSLLSANLSTAISNGVTDIGVAAYNAGAQSVGRALIGNAGAIGTAGSYIGAGMAGIAAGSMIAGDKKVIGLDGTSTSAIGAVIGGITGGPIGAFVGGVLGGVVDGLLGSGPKVSGTTTLAGNFSQQGFSGQYQTPWHQDSSWLGFGGGNGVDATALSSTQQMTINNTVAGTQSVFNNLIAASGDAQKSLTGWTFAINQQVNTQEQQTQLVNDLATSMGDYLVPSLAQFGKTGESLADTAVRMSDEFVQTSTIATLMGKTIQEAFGAVGMDSMAVRDNLVNMMGGVSAVNTAMQSYYTNFYSTAEHLTIDTNALNAQFTALGVATPATRDAFRALVNAQDLSTIAGQQMFASLMSLQGAFAAVVPDASVLADATRKMQIELMQAQGDAAGALAAQRQDELAALDPTLRALQQQIYAAQDLATASTAAATAQTDLSNALQTAISQGQSIRDFVNSLGATGATQSLAETKQVFMADLAAAQSGDAAAYGRVTSSAGNYITAGESVATSSSQQSILVAQVKAALSNLQPVAQLDQNIELLNLISANTLDTATATGDLQLNGIKAIFDLSQVITFVANSGGIPDDLRKLITDTTKDYQVVLSTALSATISDPLRQLLITGEAQYDATVKAALATLDPDVQKIAIAGVGDYTALVTAALGTGNPAAEQLALTAANNFLTTVSARLGTDSATQSLTALLNGGGGTQSVVVNGSVTFDPSNPMQSVFDAINASTGLQTTYLKTIAANQVQEATAIVNAISKTTTSVSSAQTQITAPTASLSQLSQQTTDTTAGNTLKTSYNNALAYYAGLSDTLKANDITGSLAVPINQSYAALQSARTKFFDTYGVQASFAVGSNYIPHDMVANIHAGEEITPRPYVDIQKGAREINNQLLSRLVASNEKLTDEVVQLRAENKAGQIAIATNTAKVAKMNDRWEGNGLPPARAAL